MRSLTKVTHTPSKVLDMVNNLRQSVDAVSARPIVYQAQLSQSPDASDSSQPDSPALSRDEIINTLQTAEILNNMREDINRFLRDGKIDIALYSEVAEVLKKIESKISKEKSPSVMGMDDDGVHNRSLVDNAFNNRDKPQYQYQTEDVYAIGAQIVMEAGQNPEILVRATGAFRPTNYFEGSSSTLTRGQNVNNQTTDILTTKKGLLDDNKIDKIVGVINLGDVHWVTFKIVKNIELEGNFTGYKMYYKDSMGGSEPNQNFETMAKDIFGDKLEIHCHKSLQQFDSVSCGVYALANLEILLKPTTNLLKFDEVEFYNPINDQLKDKRGEFGESYEKQQNLMLEQEETKRLEFQKITSLYTQEAEKLESDLRDKITEIRVEINIVEETKRCFFRIEMPINKNDDGYKLLSQLFDSKAIEPIKSSTVAAYKIYVDQPRKSPEIPNIGDNSSTSTESLPISVPTLQDSKQAIPSSNEEFNNLLKEKLAGVEFNINFNGPDDTCIFETSIDNCVKVTLLLSTILGMDGIEQTKGKEGMITIKLDPKKLLVKDTTPKSLDSNNGKWASLIKGQGQEGQSQG